MLFINILGGLSSSEVEQTEAFAMIHFLGKTLIRNSFNL